VGLGVLDELAAAVFALTVFLCDDLLQLKPASNPCNHPLLCHCQEVAHGAADDPLPSCRWLGEAEYSSQGFRGRLQIPRQDSSTSFFSVEVSFNGRTWSLPVFVLTALKNGKKKKKKKNSSST